jgi:putative membrane protein
MMWGYMYPWSWGGLVLMLLSMIFWIGLLGLLIWAIVRWLAPGHAFTARPPSALEIAQQRYARGEIDEATYLRIREQLTASPPPTTS